MVLATGVVPWDWQMTLSNQTIPEEVKQISPHSILVTCVVRHADG
jgi:hypothetical protein